MSKAGKASDNGVTSIGTEHPKANDIPHMSPLTHTVSRGDSMSAGSPPNNPPDLPPAAGLHRGSINGIPGGGLPGVSSSRSPVKESSYLARSASIDEYGDGLQKQVQGARGHNTITTTKEGSNSPPPRQEGIPIRR